MAGTFTTNSGPAAMETNVRGVYGYGVNVQNITSLSASGLGGQTATQVAQQVASLVNRGEGMGRAVWIIFRIRRRQGRRN